MVATLHHEFLEGHSYDFICNPVIVTNSKITLPEIFVPLNPADQFLNGYHLKIPSLKQSALVAPPNLLQQVKICHQGKISKVTPKFLSRPGQKKHH